MTCDSYLLSIFCYFLYTLLKKTISIYFLPCLFSDRFKIKNKNRKRTQAVFLSAEQKYASASDPLKRAAERSRNREVPLIHHQNPWKRF